MPLLVRVEILGQEYTLQGEGTQQEMEALAAHVDAKMREVASGSMTVDTLRIAILAAVHIAHELFECRALLERQTREIEAKAETMTTALGDALQRE